MSINIGNLLARRAHVNAKTEALYDVAADRRYTYAELNAESNRAAQLLIRSGVKKGDRVGLLLMNSAEYITAFFATALAAFFVPPCFGVCAIAELAKPAAANAENARLLHQFVIVVLRFIYPATQSRGLGSRSGWG